MPAKEETCSLVEAQLCRRKDTTNAVDRKIVNSKSVNGVEVIKYWASVIPSVNFFTIPYSASRDFLFL